MRIWCCLCIGEEEDEGYSKKRETMREREGILGNNDMDEGKFEGMGNEDLGFRAPGDNGGENFQMRLGSSGEGSSAASAQGSILDINLNLCPGEEPSSSSAAATLERDDRGVHCKRPKVHFFALEWDIPFVFMPSQECNTFFQYEYLPSTSIDKQSDHRVVATSWGANRDEHVFSETDEHDPVIRMDLTDDLLHMVFSFLEHINLCRAAKVCRQWRTGSAHEDFWRFLNFENRNISPQQWFCFEQGEDD